MEEIRTNGIEHDSDLEGEPLSANPHPVREQGRFPTPIQPYTFWNERKKVNCGVLTMEKMEPKRRVSTHPLTLSCPSAPLLNPMQSQKRFLPRW